jgi:hypothetical protein
LPHVVLDQQDGDAEPLEIRLDEAAYLVLLLPFHAGDRLVDQQHLQLGRERSRAVADCHMTGYSPVVAHLEQLEAALGDGHYSATCSGVFKSPADVRMLSSTDSSPKQPGVPEPLAADQDLAAIGAEKHR